MNGVGECYGMFLHDLYIACLFVFLIRLVATERMNGTKSGSAFSANIVEELTNFIIL